MEITEIFALMRSGEILRYALEFRLQLALLQNRDGCTELILNVLSSFADGRLLCLWSCLWWMWWSMIVVFCCAGDVDWTLSDEVVAPRGWAIIEALSPERVYEMRVVARSAAFDVESASIIQRVRIGLKRGNQYLCFSIWDHVNKKPCKVTDDHALNFGARDIFWLAVFSWKPVVGLSLFVRNKTNASIVH